jgi:hypothetical protein
MGALSSIKFEIQNANIKLDKILAILEPNKAEPKEEVKKEEKKK